MFYNIKSRKEASEKNFETPPLRRGWWQFIATTAGAHFRRRGWWHLDATTTGAHFWRRGWWQFIATTAGAHFRRRGWWHLNPITAEALYPLQRKAVLKVICTFNTAFNISNLNPLQSMPNYLLSSLLPQRSCTTH